MTAQLAPQPVFQAFAQNGAPLGGGLLSTYVAGTSKRQATYTDSTQTTQNTNPVVLNAMGQANVWLAAGQAYKFMLTDANGNPIWSVDNLTGVALYGPGDVRNYGAVVGVDCMAAITAAAAVNTYVIFPQGAWVINSVPTIPVDVVLNALPGATVSGAGASTLGFTNGALNQIIEYNTAGADFATNYFFRNANHTGGTPGNTSNALKVRTAVGASATNFEWAFLAEMDNSATGGQNVAGYLQGNKNGNVGSTWGAVIGIAELTPINNPTNGSVCLELDVNCNGTDNVGNGSRVGVDLAIRQQDTSVGAAVAQANWGFRIQNGGGASNNVGYGFAFFNNMIANVGFDTSHGIMTTAAYQLAPGQVIVFDGPSPQQQQFGYNGSGLAYNGGSPLATTLLKTGGVGVGAKQIIGGQIAGYGTPTGGARQPSFAAGSITLPNLAAAVAQLIVDLETHGLIAA